MYFHKALWHTDIVQFQYRCIYNRRSDEKAIIRDKAQIIWLELR